MVWNERLRTTKIDGVLVLEDRRELQFAKLVVWLLGVNTSYGVKFIGKFLPKIYSNFIQIIK